MRPYDYDMLFTSLHRYLGEAPGPITERMIEDAVSQRLPESGDLDWKSALPPEARFALSDIVKDMAAMANSGGGTIVFGVNETDKRAVGRQEAGELNEGYERTLRRVAYTAIHTADPRHPCRAHCRRWSARDCDCHS